MESIRKTKMCIYQIMHKASNIKYIGQTVGYVGRRWDQHYNLKSSRSKITNALQKYGKNAFVYSVLEVCGTIDQLNEREEFWIKDLDTLSPNGYNLHGGGLNHVCSEETKLKLSEYNMGKVQSEETKAKRSKSSKGRIVSKETRKLLSDAHKGKILSEETKTKLSEINKGKSIPYETRLKISIAMRGRKWSDGRKSRKSFI